MGLVAKLGGLYFIENPKDSGLILLARESGAGLKLSLVDSAERINAGVNPLLISGQKYVGWGLFAPRDCADV